MNLFFGIAALIKHKEPKIHSLSASNTFAKSLFSQE
ncbi:hypothetical protein B6N60_04482 [Richelia sinica FACHB-800]|uniref:Uncharacterized protein n=1 Tax=Richelia sinica FACHB-800 TaxID=1357546 RepID=A0A975TBP5_9NOST|nr:hypothetical protein B6N60_04482 [Richelia sinica FACHB-800]